MGKARILTASAGAGKTYQLAYKYVSDVIERPWFYRHILAVTFSDAVARTALSTSAASNAIVSNLESHF